MIQRKKSLLRIQSRKKLKRTNVSNTIDLHPDITFDDGFSVGEEKLKKMQERAHNYCFIANTLADSVTVNINS